MVKNKNMMNLFLPLIWAYNVVLLILGVLTIFYGTYLSIMSYIHDMVYIHDEIGVTTISSLIMTLGVAKVLASLSGFFYAITQLKYFLLMNFIVVVFGLGMENKIFISLNSIRSSLEKKLAWHFKLDINEYFVSGLVTDLDEIQSKYKCCGWRDAEDYNEGHFPISCCDAQVCNAKNSYNISCSKATFKVIDSYFGHALFAMKLGCVISLSCCWIMVLVYHLIYRKHKKPKKK